MQHLYLDVANRLNSYVTRFIAGVGSSAATVALGSLLTVYNQSRNFLASAGRVFAAPLPTTVAFASAAYSTSDSALPATAARRNTTGSGVTGNSEGGGGTAPSPAPSERISGGAAPTPSEHTSGGVDLSAVVAQQGIAIAALRSMLSKQSEAASAVAPAKTELRSAHSPAAVASAQTTASAAPIVASSSLPASAASAFERSRFSHGGHPTCNPIASSSLFADVGALGTHDVVAAIDDAAAHPNVVAAQPEWNTEFDTLSRFVADYSHSR